MKVEDLKQELKPCPFCGNKAIFTTNSSGKWWIRCDKEFWCVETQFEDTKEDVIDVWNNRVKL